MTVIKNAGRKHPETETLATAKYKTSVIRSILSISSTYLSVTFDDSAFKDPAISEDNIPKKCNKNDRALTFVNEFIVFFDQL